MHWGRGCIILRKKLLPVAKNNYVCMSKESWCVRLKDRSVIVCVRVGKTVCNILKGGGLEKWGGETKLKIKGGKAGSRCGYLERGGGDGTTLQTMLYFYVTYTSSSI